MTMAVPEVGAQAIESGARRGLEGFGSASTFSRLAPSLRCASASLVPRSPKRVRLARAVSPSRLNMLAPSSLGLDGEPLTPVQIGGCPAGPKNGPAGHMDPPCAVGRRRWLRWYQRLFRDVLTAPSASIRGWFLTITASIGRDMLWGIRLVIAQRMPASRAVHRWSGEPLGSLGRPRVVRPLQTPLHLRNGSAKGIT
jgi:hypothetical protein